MEVTENGVTEISLVDLNTEDTSLNNLGKDVTKIEILTINDSYVPTLRALSSNLRALQVLKIPNCGVKDLDGLSICQNLREIYLPFNEITTIASIMFLTNLEIVDFESNFIDGAQELDYLSILGKLKLLNLANNPVCDLPNYRETIYSHAPNLQILDDGAYDCASSCSSRSSSHSRNSSRPGSRRGSELKHQVREMEESVSLVQEICDDNNRQEQQSSMFFPPVVPSGMVHRPKTTIGGYRTGRPSTARPSSSRGSRGQPQNDLRSSMSSGYSDLTTGAVMVGSAARSLKSRNKAQLSALQKQSDMEAQRPQTSSGFRRNSNNISPVKQVHRPDSQDGTVDSQLTQVEDETDALLRELQEWRVQHEKALADIKSQIPVPAQKPTKPRPPPVAPSEGTPYSSGSSRYGAQFNASGAGSGAASSYTGEAKRIVEAGKGANAVQPQPPKSSNFKNSARYRQFMRRRDIAVAAKAAAKGDNIIDRPIVSPATSIPSSTSPQQTAK